MEPENELPYSQVSADSLYLEPDESNPHLKTFFSLRPDQASEYHTLGSKLGASSLTRYLCALRAKAISNIY